MENALSIDTYFLLKSAKSVDSLCFRAEYIFSVYFLSGRLLTMFGPGKVLSLERDYEFLNLLH